MRRRFLGLSLALFACPVLLRAQPARKPVRIGVLSSTSPETRSPWWDAFKEAMTRLGWAEGRDISYSYRFARGDETRFEALAAELAAEKPDLLFGGLTAAALALQKATRQIPIVFAFATDPVGAGLVASLRRPGGNATGLTGTSSAMRAKGLELLKEIRPQLRVVAVVISRTAVGERIFSEIEQATRALGIKVERVVVANQDEVLASLRSFAGKHYDGILFQTGMIARETIVQHMAELRLPAVYAASELVVSGGLMSYGPDLADNYRRAAGYADKMLRGARAADLPVEQPEKFDLVVNLKAARMQGITIPQSLLLRATRVIE
ncbi:MAG: ABC transporter substrate-binding protein [Betaproteobacteria bacterium]